MGSWKLRLAGSVVKLGTTQGNFGIVVQGKGAFVGGKTRRLQQFHFRTVTVRPLVFCPALALISLRSQ
jgi:hypothetical protein